MLREHGYETYWYGKWHLTHRDNRWTQAIGRPALESYGFSGGTYPSPDGAPGPGLARRPDDRRAVRALVRARGRRRPVVHDRLARQSRTTSPGGTAGATASPDERARRATSPRCRPTSRRPSSSSARRKPSLQRSLQDTSAQLVRCRCRSPGRDAQAPLAAVPRPLRQAPASRSIVTIGRVLRTL